MMKLSRFVIFIFVMLICGCGRSTPTNYYLLESSLGPFQADNLPAKTLRVAQVEVPGYLNRNNIVSRINGETKLILAEFHLWAEPVSSGVRRVIEEMLTRPLLRSGINVLPSGTASGGDFVLLLDVQRFDGNFNEKAVLECRWAILDKNERPLQRGIFSAEEQVNGADYNILVGAESQLLKDFGKYLSDKLPPILTKYSDRNR